MNDEAKFLVENLLRAARVLRHVLYRIRTMRHLRVGIPDLKQQLQEHFWLVEEVASMVVLIVQNRLGTDLETAVTRMKSLWELADGETVPAAVQETLFAMGDVVKPANSILGNGPGAGYGVSGEWHRVDRAIRRLGQAVGDSAQAEPKAGGREPREGDVDAYADYVRDGALVLCPTPVAVLASDMRTAIRILREDPPEDCWSCAARRAQVFRHELGLLESAARRWGLDSAPVLRAVKEGASFAA